MSDANGKPAHLFLQEENPGNGKENVRGGFAALSNLNGATPTLDWTYPIVPIYSGAGSTGQGLSIYYGKQGIPGLFAGWELAEKTPEYKSTFARFINIV